MPSVAKSINRLVGKAMHTYDMLADGDRVLVTVSGGVDSLTLALLLDKWRRKAPIAYELLAVHVDMGFGAAMRELVEEQLRLVALPFRILETDFGKRAAEELDGKSACFECARQRRNRLFAFAREQSFSKIAFAHHKEDIIETFFLNLLYGGNLSTMVPRQELFAGRLTIIRPLAFVEKSDIMVLAGQFGVRPVANPCPWSSRSKRDRVRELLAALYGNNPRIKSNIFAALANSRPDYLLSPPASTPDPLDHR